MEGLADLTENFLGPPFLPDLSYPTSHSLPICPLQYFPVLPGKFHGQKGLEGSPCGPKELDMTEHITHMSMGEQTEGWAVKQ